ncbi:MAG: DUF5698 domain-containing protein [Nocardioidaceae bacterium]
MFGHALPTGTALQALLTLALVLTEVALWQWRVLLTNKGARILPAVLGMAGAVLQVTAIAQVVTNTGDPVMVAAYAVGVGGGVFVGVVVAGRTARTTAEPTADVPAGSSHRVTARRDERLSAGTGPQTVRPGPGRGARPCVSARPHA